MKYEHWMKIDDNVLFAAGSAPCGGVNRAALWGTFEAEATEEFGEGTRLLPQLRRIGENAYVFAESDRLWLGEDHGNFGSGLFVLPKRYFLFGKDHPDLERRYLIDKEVARGFMRLARRYPPGSFPSFYTPLLVE